jgi:membrane-associated protease RseP (regulator of RpoE activity)
VDAVAPESPAAKAGLQVGDSITVINGELVSGRDLVLAPLLKPGLSLPMKYRRGGKEREISVAITKRPGMFGDPCGDIAVRVMRGPGGTSTVEFFPDSLMVSGGPRPGARVVRIPRPPSTPRAPDGVTVEWSGPTAPSGNFFSFERMPAVIAGAELRKLSTDLADVLGVEKGIFVVSVAPRSPAEEGGVRGGDVIVKAGDTEVTTTRELSMAVGKADHRITLEIIRKRKPITLSLTW